MIIEWISYIPSISNALIASVNDFSLNISCDRFLTWCWIDWILLYISWLNSINIHLRLLTDNFNTNIVMESLKKLSSFKNWVSSLFNNSRCQTLYVVYFIGRKLVGYFWQKSGLECTKNSIFPTFSGESP